MEEVKSGLQVVPIMGHYTADIGYYSSTWNGSAFILSVGNTQNVSTLFKNDRQV